MANLTYSPGWAGLFADTLAALDRTGALRPRVVQPSPALLSAQKDVSQLIMKWDDALATRMAPGLDVEKMRRQIAAMSPWGSCKAGDILAGDGSRNSTVRFT